MNWKTKMAFGLTAVMLLGIAAAVSASDEVGEYAGFGKRGFAKDHAFMGFGAMIGGGRVSEDLGLPENTTREQAREALWSTRLQELGLTEDSTIRQLHGVLKARQDVVREQRHEHVRQNLGLDESAGCLEIREAVKARCMENPQDCPNRLNAGFFRKGFKR